MLNAIDGVIANVDSFNRLGKLLVIGPFLALSWRRRTAAQESHFYAAKGGICSNSWADP